MMEIMKQGIAFVLTVAKLFHFEAADDKEDGA
jgi:hypothetical protein